MPKDKLRCYNKWLWEWKYVLPSGSEVDWRYIKWITILEVETCFASALKDLCKSDMILAVWMMIDQN